MPVHDRRFCWCKNARHSTITVPGPMSKVQARCLILGRDIDDRLSSHGCGPRTLDFQTLDILHILILIIAAFAAGAINSIAGGGTLITFPVLVWLGLDPKVANA